MRCFLYARVSLEEQAEQFGLPSQIRAMHELASAKGYGKPEELIDDGYLGADLDRPALTRLRSLVRSGQIDVAIAHDPDRLSRNLAHLLILRDEFERAGVRLEFVTTPSADTPEAKMFLNMKGVFAEYEREKIRERTMRGRREKARQGFIVGGRVPFGYTYLGKAEGERGRLVIDPDRVSAVKRIFQWADDGLSAREIAVRLNESGVRPLLAGRWGRSSVRRLLQNTTYIGEAHYNRHKRVEPRNPDAEHKNRHNKYTTLRERPPAEWISVPTPAIIEPALFERVAERLRRNRETLSGRPSRRYLLRGFLWCGKCGRRMNGDPNHGTPYYRCPGRDRLIPAAKRCHALVNVARLDAAVWSALSGPFKEPARLREIIERNQSAFKPTEGKRKPSILRRRLSELRGREARGVKALMDARLSAQYELIQRELTAMADQRRKLEWELANGESASDMSAATDVDAICGEIASVIDRLQAEQRQEFMRRIVERITVVGEDVAIHCALPQTIVSGAKNCTDHEHIVAPGGCHFEGALGRGLPAHITKVGSRGLGHVDRRELPDRGSEFRGPRQQRDHFRQVPHTEHMHALDYRGLRRIIERQHKMTDTLRASTHGHRKSSAHRPDRAVERQFAHE
jgi:site-specific DNA recombinase